LSHVGCFRDKVAQEQVAKAAKTKGGSTPSKSSASKPPISNTLRDPPASKGTNIASGSTPTLADQKADNKLKETMGTKDKEVLIDPSNSNKKLIIFLRNNLDVFAWKISDMPGIPREVIEHKLDIDPPYKPIKQKEKSYTPERHETIRQEVNKLLEVGFIRPVDYRSWLANAVLVEKSDDS
jgi:hypothetical protein